MELKIGNISAVELAKTYGTPIYVYDKQIIIKRIQQLKQAFANTKISYAVKANANPKLLKIIAQEGLSADCTNRIEIKQAQDAGFAFAFTA